MKVSVIAAVVLVLATNSSSLAQLTIQNPDHQAVPEQKASLLMSTACRVTSEHFSGGKASPRKFSLTLVLGSADEHYTADEDKDSYKLFLRRWDENKFAEAVTNLAIQRLVVHDRLASMVAEVLRRSVQVTPVPVTELHESKGLTLPLGGSKGLGGPAPSETSGCLSGVTEAALRNIACGSLSNQVPSTPTLEVRPH